MNDLPALPSALGAQREARRISGGQTGTVWLVELVDGRRVVVKRTPADADLEAEGLDALREAGANTPEVLHADGDVLVVEHVTGPADLVALGRGLALAHSTTSPSFGWHRDNVLGPLAQCNNSVDDWPPFFIEHRLRPHLDVLPVELARRTEQVLDGHLSELLDHDAVPSLVHGDLWAGNIVDGRWLIDPAVHFADAEIDFAMLELFGGIPDALLDGYRQIRDLDDGWELRRPALQLYYLLVHVRLFGSSYLAPIAQRLDRWS